MQQPTRETTNIETAARYIQAIADGATGEALAVFLHPDIVQHEHPNRLVPQGRARDKHALLADADKGQNILSAQRYDVRSAIAQGDRVALEVVWTGTLAVPVGTLPAGYEMRARLGIFLELRDGQIIAQNNYDCFEPW